MKRVVITSSIILTFIIIGTIAAIIYAKGYRVNGTHIEGTGILTVSSKPEGARVYINGHLTTATNNTLNLAPGDYDVEIQKDGYFPWKKKVSVKQEIVREANATLYPSTPKLEPATITGANNPVLDPSGSIVAFTLPSSLPGKSGIYTLDMNSRPILNIGGATNQIADNTIAEFSQATLSFSPDGKDLLASVSGNLGTSYFLLSPRNNNQNPQDVTNTLVQVQDQWNKLTQTKNKRLLETFPKKLRNAYTTYFTNPILSPDSDEILYTASISGTLPLVKTPRWTSINSTPEDRDLKQGNVYVYDITDDRNYLLYSPPNVPNIASASNPDFKWLADSRHLAFIENKTIHVIEFDGNNTVTVYGGPFEDHYLFPWPDGSALMILTNQNIPDAPNNLYRISLK